MNGGGGKQQSLTILSLPVEGMTCASCVLRVEKALKGVEGVAEATVNLATEQATVTFDPARAGVGELEHAVAEAGYTLRSPAAGGSPEAARPEERASKSSRNALVLSLAFWVPVMALSMLSMTAWYRDSSPLTAQETNSLLLVLTTPILVVGGRNFFRGFVAATRHRTADMNTLVAVGTGAAYAYSAVRVLFPSALGGEASGHVYFDTAATIITLVLLGKTLEAGAKRRASAAIRALFQLQPATATQITTAGDVTIPVSSIRVGMSLRIRPGERVPTDGTVAAGTSTVDESMVTGESMPVENAPGARVIGGTVNHTGSIEVRATAVGRDTVLSHIIRMVERAQASKAPIQSLADRIAAVFVPAVLLASVVTFVAWISASGLEIALANAIAVLIIACPCALGLATPTAIIVGTGAGAARGIYFRDVASLEKLRVVHTVVLDKTGTVTEGQPSVVHMTAFPPAEERHVLELAGAVERHSAHPIARAITLHASRHAGLLPNAEGFVSLTGFGVTARVDGKSVLVGSESLMRERGVVLDPGEAASVLLNREGITAVYVAVETRLAGIIGIADPVKPSAPAVIGELRRMGLETVLLTGDSVAVAESVSRRLGTDRVIANVLPEEKAEHIRQLQEGGHHAAMVGDGINDAPALALASVGVAMGTGTEVAMETADVTLMRGDLRLLVDAILLSRRTVRTIRQNFFWAFLYNTVGIPVAALGLLNPMVAASAMAFSSVSVVSNSLRLRRFRRGLGPLS